MRTNTAAAKAITSANKVTADGSAGADNQSKPLKVTIDGTLSELLRAESNETGMTPLTLVKQRLKLASLLIEDSEEGKAFRLDIAEKAFSDAGKTSVSAKSEKHPPSECITALVRPHDAAWVAELSKRYEAPPWIVASVLVRIGSEALVNEDAAEAVHSNCALLLWRCIYRNASHFTKPIPVFVDCEENIHVHDQAEKLGRELTDWMGTLIMLGVEAVKDKRDLSFLTADSQFKLLADASELRLRKEMDEVSIRILGAKPERSEA